MQALRSLASDTDILLEDTSKLYFGRYPIKIVFQRSAYGARVLPRSQAYRWLKIDEELIEDLGLSGRVEARRKLENTILYCVDEATALALCARLGSSVSKIICPRHTGDLIALEGSGTRVRHVLRDTLFWGHFRYALTLEEVVRKDSTIFDDIKLWVAQFCAMNNEASIARVENGAPPRVYFTCEDDITYFKLVFHEFIRDFEKAILFEEIDHAHESFAAVC